MVGEGALILPVCAILCRDRLFVLESIAFFGVGIGRVIKGIC